LRKTFAKAKKVLSDCRNAISSRDLDIVEAQGRARVVTDELDRLEALIASLEESEVSETTDVDALKAEINSLEERIQQLREAAEADGGRSAREFQGEGNRQYLTGLKLGW
jgi:chromosome segregation ATPase